jgi:hypothetical protein
VIHESQCSRPHSAPRATNVVAIRRQADRGAVELPRKLPTRPSRLLTDMMQARSLILRTLDALRETPRPRQVPMTAEELKATGGVAAEIAVAAAQFAEGPPLRAIER